MKRRAVQVEVSDHAVLRWLEREHGLDVAAVKAAISGVVMGGAELAAMNVVLGRARFVLKQMPPRLEGGAPAVVVVTTKLKGFHREAEERRGG